MQRGGTFFRLTSGSADNPDYFLNRVQVLCKDSFFLLQVTFLNNDFSADGSAVPGNKGKLHERSKCCKFTSNLGERNFLINQEYAKPRELNIEIWTVFLPTISLKDPERRHRKRNFLESFSGHKFPCEFRMDNNEQFAYAVREERNLPTCAEQCTCG